MQTGEFFDALLDSNKAGLEKMMPVIYCDNLTFSYPEQANLFYRAQIRIDAGQFYYLSGPSGAGKTTLLKLLYGALAPVSGTVCVLGQHLQSLSSRDLSLLRQQMGLIFQEPALLPHLTVLDNVALPLVILNEDLSDARRKAYDLLSWLDLKSVVFLLPRTLSGGEKQRVALARAIIHSPTLILADEPTNHLSQTDLEKLFTLFQELQRRGTTIICATHQQSLKAQFPSPEYTITQRQLQLTSTRAKRFKDAS